MAQQVLLDDILTLEDLCWIQRWAALLPELVADFEDFDQSHLATKLRAKLRLAHGPGPETRRRASERRMKSLVDSMKNNNTALETSEFEKHRRGRKI